MSWCLRQTPVAAALAHAAYVAFKLHRASSGDVLLHDTVVQGGDELGIYRGPPLRRSTLGCSAAEDACVVISGINTGFAGVAPVVGA